MRLLALIEAGLILTASGTAFSSTYTVDPTGAGDFERVPEAWAVAGYSDTVLLMPGIHLVGGGVPGWPLLVGEDSPWLVGSAGPEVTLLIGDTVTPVFRITPDPDVPHTRIRGVTIRNVGQIIHREHWQTGYLCFLNNIVEDCGTLNASHCTSGSRVSECVFRNGTGAAIGTYHNNGRVSYNEIYGYSGSAIAGVCCEEVWVHHNHLHDNGGAGVSCGFHYEVTDNLIEDNAGAGIVIGSGGVFERNVIRGNTLGIEHWDSLGFIRLNDIYDNTEFNLLFHSSYVGDKDVTMNWWGTVVLEEIMDGIWDCDDDPAVGLCAVVDPWCTSPGCEPTAVESTSWGSIKAQYR